MTIRAEIQSLAPSALLDFFILDTTNLPGGSLMRFHAGTNGLSQPVVWQGATYEPLPIEASGFDVTARGSLPRPKLKVANAAGFLSASVKSFGDFVGCKVTRKRTFAKYLDAVNFPVRRNLFAQTDSLTGGGGLNWTRGSSIASVVDGQLGPDANYTATRFNKLIGVTISSTGTTVYRSFVSGIGQEYTIAIDVLPNSTGVFVIRYGTSTASVTKSFNLVAGSGWQRLTATFINPAGVTGTFCVFGSDATGIDVTLANAQAERDSSATAYQSVGLTFVQNPTADPNQFIPDDLWYVERKVTENRYIIEFELSSAFDLMGQQLPNRQIIQNSCSWKYRSTECGWTGANYDKNNAPSTLANDACAKTLAACKVRFGTQPIRFGGFPGAVRGTT
jgi:phage-related protein